MPSGYTISHDQGLIAIHGADLVSIPVAIEIGRSILNDPKFDPQLAQLFDLRGLIIERSRQEAEEFRHFALFEYFPKVRGAVAVVVDDSLARIPLADLYHLTAQVDFVEMFDSYDQALRWLMRRAFVQAH